MKTIIEYDDSEDDQMALKRAMKSTDMACVLFEIQINMKKNIVHMLDAYNATDAEYELLDNVWKCINEEFESHKIHVDELID
jgi:hypothetical protein